MEGRYGYGPDPTTVQRWPWAPEYFLRMYDLTRSTIGHVEKSPETGKMMVVDEELLHPGGGVLAICGFSIKSTFEEDWKLEEEAYERSGTFMAWNYSVMSPEGELGFVPFTEVAVISQEEFEKALDLVRKGSHE